MRKNTFEKKKGSQPGFVGLHESQVNLAGQPDLPDFCSFQSFALPESIQPPGRLAGPIQI